MPAAIRRKTRLTVCDWNRLLFALHCVTFRGISSAENIDDSIPHSGISERICFETEKFTIVNLYNVLVDYLCAKHIDTSEMVVLEKINKISITFSENGENS